MILKRIQLGLIHVAIAVSLVPFNSTLNRVMIHELELSTLLVAALVSLPYVFSPIQIAIGHFSDKHPLFGYRRTPYILLGLLLCVGGLMLAPTTAYLIAEQPALGISIGVVVFGLWGMGYNLASVSYFSLATELSGEKGRSRTIAVMFFMMIVSIILTSLTLSRLLETYTPETLNSAFRLVGFAALGLGLLGIIGLEKPSAQSKTAAEADEAEPQSEQGWREIFRTLSQNKQAIRFFWYLLLLLTAILGQDILLEPYGAQAFGMSVQETTLITSIWGGFFLLSLSVGAALERQVSKLVQVRLGAWLAIAAFALIVLSSSAGGLWLFYTGVILLGLATGLSTVSNLSLMLDMTTVGSVGMFIGAWGMASALARLAGNLLSGAIREGITLLLDQPVWGYAVVFIVEIVFLIISLMILQRVDVSLFQKHSDQNMSYMERVAISNEG